MRTTALGIATLIGSIAIAACGDDTEPLSRAEFIEQADAICADFQEQIAPIFESVWDMLEGGAAMEDETTIFVRFDDALDDALPLFEEQLGRLRELEPPAEDSELIEELHDDYEAAIAEGVELFAAAADGDRAAMARLDSDDPVDAVDTRVRAYGMKVCGGEG